jgi:hypothetical protein
MLKFNQFNSINENNSNIPKKVVRDFYKTVYSYKGFISIMEEYEYSELHDDYDENDYGTTMVLMPTEYLENPISDENSRNLKEYSIDKEIKYLIMMIEYSMMNIDYTFWLYKNNQFVRIDKHKDKEEDMCLYLNADELSNSIDWDNVHYVDYKKWKEYKEKTINAFKSFNDI